MKILWFEVTEPAGYRNAGEFIGGWQDSLEGILKKEADIDLFVAFSTYAPAERKKDGNVTYVPIVLQFSFYEKLKSFCSCSLESKYLIPQALSLISEINPDVIHIFGLEWPWGLVAEKIDIPVVIHIMGSMVPYYNALYPPKYSFSTVAHRLFPDFRGIIWFLLNDRKQKSRMEQEKRIWKCVHNYMGRTEWDYNLSCIMSPRSKYFHVDEALRTVFLNNSNQWKPSDGKIRLISTGASTFWKGPDMLLKTAKILKDNDIDFEWNVVGGMRATIQRIVEKKENTNFAECGVIFLGFKNSYELLTLLRESTLYVHTAYIENSPNSICEAQCVGVPVVSTNVGGISTLVSDKVDGLLVAANDPWQMAASIISLLKDKERMMLYSSKAKEKALKRHDSSIIVRDLLGCYRELAM